MDEQAVSKRCLDKDLVVLEFLQDSWSERLVRSSEQALVRDFFKDPSVFKIPEMKDAVYLGTKLSDERQFLLLNEAVVTVLKQHLSRAISRIRNRPNKDYNDHAESSQGRKRKLGHSQHQSDRHSGQQSWRQAEPAGAPADGYRNDASGRDDPYFQSWDQTLPSMSVDDDGGLTFEISQSTEQNPMSISSYDQQPISSLPLEGLQQEEDHLDILPGLPLLRRVHAGQQFTNIVSVDMSDNAKCLAVFKGIMKNNKDIKKNRQHLERLKEAQRQLQVAQAMVTRHQGMASTSNTTDNSIQQATVDAEHLKGEMPSKCLDASSGHRAVCTDPHAVFISVDLEWHESNQSCLLEIGWSSWDSLTGEIKSKHWIVEESRFVQNGKYVPDCKNDFRFGKSEIGPKKEGATALQRDLDPQTWALHFLNHDQQNPMSQQALPRPVLALVGHGLAGDMKLMEAMGIKLAPGTDVIDTNNLAWALLGGKQEMFSLKSLLDWVNISDVLKLHNAGNDARYTLQAMLELTKGLPGGVTKC